ncbi:hypothetical protein SAMN06295989_1029 [Methanohalophilus euhalobius]|uniref:Uncharacterized protein n=1 Tax=Methanohalophilus euhalobius TaxID=51203 RepID=A0A285EZ36_9EURY|nr:hypothetical protein SAMN06295989_1029 [Methanohalophilus euhalobius]
MIECNFSISGNLTGYNQTLEGLKLLFRRYFNKLINTK